MKKLERFLEILKYNKNLVIISSLTILCIHQCSLKRGYHKNLNKETVKVNDCINQLDSLKNLLEQANSQINYLEGRFNDESEVTKQYVRFKLTYLKDNKHNGSISFIYPNGNAYIQGFLNQGEERGKWEFFNMDRSIDQIYDHPLVCVGSKCCDGTTSYSTGRGTCSWHGGVCATLFEYKKRYLNIGGVAQ